MLYYEYILGLPTVPVSQEAGIFYILRYTFSFLSITSSSESRNKAEIRKGIFEKSLTPEMTRLLSYRGLRVSLHFSEWISYDPSVVPR